MYTCSHSHHYSLPHIDDNNEVEVLIDDKYLNFSNPLIAKNFDPHACGWAYGMNMFDLSEWRKQNITEVYHTWQKLVSIYDLYMWNCASGSHAILKYALKCLSLITANI